MYIRLQALTFDQSDGLALLRVLKPFGDSASLFTMTVLAQGGLKRYRRASVDRFIEKHHDLAWNSIQLQAVTNVGELEARLSGSPTSNSWNRLETSSKGQYIENPSIAAAKNLQSVVEYNQVKVYPYSLLSLLSLTDPAIGWKLCLAAIEEADAVDGVYGAIDAVDAMGAVWTDPMVHALDRPPGAIDQNRELFDGVHQIMFSRGLLGNRLAATSEGIARAKQIMTTKSGIVAVDCRQCDWAQALAVYRDGAVIVNEITMPDRPVSRG